jgi:hypothetical protein
MANKRVDSQDLAGGSAMGSGSKLGAARYRRQAAEAKRPRINLFWTTVLFIVLLVAVLVIALEFSR